MFTYAETLGGYPAAMRAVAANKGVALIDLNTETKTLLAGKKADELTAFYAKNSDGETSDPAHFSPDGALTLAKYIAGQLETAAPALAEYLKADYANVAASDISYGSTYLRMNFQNATTDTTNNVIAGIYRNNKSFGSITDTRHTTSAYTDNDKNRAIKFVSNDSDKGIVAYYDTYDTNAGIDAPLVCVDFSIMFPEYTNLTTKASFEVKSAKYDGSGYKRQATLNFTSDSKGVSVSVKSSKTDSTATSGYSDRTVSFTNVVSLKQGEWNKFRLIMDQENKKYHIIANEKLVCTDIPYNTQNIALDQNLNFIYIGTDYSAAGSEVYYDDIYVKSISERQAIKMLLEGADEFMASKVFEVKETATDGLIAGERIIFPAHATTAANRSIIWNLPEQSKTVYYNASFFGGKDVSEDKDLSASTAPYHQSYFVYSPVGYNDAIDGKLQFKPIISVGNTTTTAGELITESMTIKRRLMVDSEDSLEIGVPKMLDSASFIMPNGSNAGWASRYNSISSSGTVWTQTVIANKGNADRKLIVGLCFYKDAKLATVSKPAVLTVAKNSSSTYNVGTDVANLSADMTAKFFVLDAETLEPIMDAITIE